MNTIDQSLVQVHIPYEGFWFELHHTKHIFWLESCDQVDNFIHADLHPGNILVRMEPGNPAPNKQMFRSRPHVVLLDVGMTAELNPQDRYTLLDFFKAVALKDGRRTAECTLKFSRAQRCPNPQAFIDVSFALFSNFSCE